MISRNFLASFLMLISLISVFLINAIILISHRTESANEDAHYAHDANDAQTQINQLVSDVKSENFSSRRFQKRRQSFHSNETNLRDHLISAEEFKTLIDLNDFRFLINNNKCYSVNYVKIMNDFNQDAKYERQGNVSLFPSDADEKKLSLLIFVHSAPNHFRERNLIRKSWGKELSYDGVSIKTVFMIGKIGAKNGDAETNEGRLNHYKLQDSLYRENYHHRDIIQGNFIDSYRNLTYKHAMGLKWVKYFCNNADYVLKTDDDNYINIFTVIQFLKTPNWRWNPNAPELMNNLNEMRRQSLKSNLMACFLIKNSFAKRSFRSKWRVSFQEYSSRYYPNYCNGWFVLMSRDVALGLETLTHSTPYFWIDDVLITGIIASKIGVKHIDLSEYFDISVGTVDELLSRRASDFPIGLPNISFEDLYRLSVIKN